MAIESPVQVLQRLREQARQERLVRAQEPHKRFLTARRPKQKAKAFGAQIGTALAQALLPEDDLSKDPAVQQAEARAEWLNVAPDDIAGLKANIKASAEAGDYEVSSYLTDRYIQAERLRLARLNAEKTDEKPKSWKWKHWQTDTRNTLSAQAREENWVKDINNEEEEQKVADAIVSRAESLWNTWRERGIDVEPERAYSLAVRTAQKHFEPGFFNDTFNFEGFRDDFSSSFNLGADKFEGEEDEITTPTPRKAPPKRGEVRNGYRFLGGDPADAANWRKVGSAPEEEEKPRKRSSADDSLFDL